MSTQRVRTLKDFAATKGRLLRAYDHVLGGGLLPVGRLDEAKVREKRKNLDSERFIVAVCGQIKSGKSSILNALIFGRPVLPTNDTIMTAKNTLIRYGASPAIEVEFYSSEEWTAITTELQRDPSTWNSFEAEIQAAAEEGVLKDEWVQLSRRVERMAGVGRLREYVTPVKEGGRYSPFVKLVTIEYDHPWLADVTVADTPGVNDPLKYREDITKQWIHNAGAVLYVSYAGQPLSLPDCQFLDEYLLAVPSDRRVIAVNKIDLVEGRGALEAWLNGLIRGGDARNRSMFGDRGSMVYTCALGGLIQSMLDAGLDLDPELSEYREILGEGGFLAPEKHQIGELRALVEDRLLRNKGDALLKEHASFLDTLFERKRELLRQEVESANAYHTSLTQSDQERAEEKRRIEQQISRLNQRMEEFAGRLRRSLDGHFRHLSAFILEIRDAAVDEIQKRLARYWDIEEIARNGAWIIRDAVAAQQRTLHQKVTSILEDVEGQFKRDISELQTILDEDGAGTSLRVSVFVDLPVYDTIREIRKSFHEEASRDRLQSVVNDATNWWQRLWNTSGGQNAAKDAVENLARDLLHSKLEESLVTAIRREIEEATSRARKEIQDGINRALETRRREIDEIDRGSKDLQAEIERVRGQIRELSMTQQQVESLRRETETIRLGQGGQHEAPEMSDSGSEACGACGQEVPMEDPEPVESSARGD